VAPWAEPRAHRRPNCESAQAVKFTASGRTKKDWPLCSHGVSCPETDKTVHRGLDSPGSACWHALDFIGNSACREVPHPTPRANILLCRVIIAGFLPIFPSGRYWLEVIPRNKDFLRSAVDTVTVTGSAYATKGTRNDYGKRTLAR
jgi:hypothetical protein